MEELHNFTRPENPEEEDDPLPNGEGYEAARNSMVGLFVIIFLSSLVGNSLIFHLVRTRKSIRKNQFYWLIVNTAVADLMDVVTASAFWMAYFIVGERWGLGVFGATLCKIIPFLVVVSTCAAIWTLTVIAVDRYLVIVSLRRRNLSSRSVVLSIAVVWLCSLLIGSVQLYKYKTLTEEDGTVHCVEEWHEESSEMSVLMYKTEMVVRVVTTFAIPLVVMAVLYFLIARFLCKQKPVVNAHQQAQVNKRKTVVTKKLITAVTVYALCWFPVHLFAVLLESNPDDDIDIPVLVEWLFFWLAHAHAAINSWLFIAFGEQLREGTKEIYRNSRNKLRLRTGSTPNLGSIDDPLPRSVTPEGNDRSAEQDT